LLLSNGDKILKKGYTKDKIGIKTPIVFYRGIVYKISLILFGMACFIGSIIYIKYRIDITNFMFWLIFSFLFLVGFYLSFIHSYKFITILKNGRKIKSTSKEEIELEYFDFLEDEKNDPFEKWLMVKSIIKYNIRNAVPILIDYLLPNYDENLIKNKQLYPIILLASGKLKNESIIPDLLLILENEQSFNLRRIIIWALGEIGGNSHHVIRKLLTLNKYEGNFIFKKYIINSIEKILIPHGFSSIEDFNIKYKNYKENHQSQNYSEDQKIIFENISLDPTETYYRFNLDKNINTKYDKMPIEEIIDIGENEFIEFKSSLRWNKNGEKKEELEYDVMLAISSFLNTSGGIVIIGIDDNKNVVGINKDYKNLGKRNSDGYELLFSNLLKKYMESNIKQKIRIRFPKYNNLDLCQIIIPQRSTKPEFIKKGKKHNFAVREGNESPEKDPKETVFYIKETWSDFFIN